MTDAFKHFNQKHKEPGCNFISITQACEDQQHSEPDRESTVNVKQGPVS